MLVSARTHEIKLSASSVERTHAAARRRSERLQPTARDPARPLVGRRGDAQFYKDAIIHELQVRSFQDSRGNGIGDFNGLRSRLPHLQDLGITALWLLPSTLRPRATTVRTSPTADFGLVKAAKAAPQISLSRPVAYLCSRLAISV